MKLIVGLGNVGGEYEGTRHNVGFAFLEYMRARMEWWEFGLKASLRAMILKEKEVILMKPTTMMNLSGEAVEKVMSFYQIKAENLLVVHDDLDLVVGSWKCQMGKGPKIHNGINNIEAVLKTKDFWRVRVGVDGREGDRKQEPQAYVLGRMEMVETKLTEKVFEEVFDYLEQQWLR